MGMPSSRPPRIRAWRPFLTGVVLGLALLMAIGMAVAQSVDQAPFDALLKTHVKNGVVDYPGFQDDPAFRPYLDALAKPAVHANNGERLAYYINAYNALAIEGILEGLSPSSLLGQLRYFKLKDWPLDGQVISLYDLEHKVIRPLREPRIHFAIVCASVSCPRLRSQAYSAAALERQLDEQARQFINDPSRNRFDGAMRTAYLSKIFEWFDEDFKAASGSTQKYLAQYVADPGIARDLATDGYKVESIPYDWNLNGVPPRR
jgi:hypothetical protein